MNSPSVYTDYKLLNYSRGAKESGEPIRGCRSCLLRPSCDGRIETPDGALLLVPDPRTCQYETGLTITIQQHPLIRALIATLNELARFDPLEANYVPLIARMSGLE